MTAVLFGSLPFPGQDGSQLVSRVVTTAIAALFKTTQKLEANVRAEPVAKLLQGSVDGFDFIGQGLLMYSGLRVEPGFLTRESKKGATNCEKCSYDRASSRLSL